MYLFDADLVHLAISKISLYDVINNGSSLLIVDNSFNNVINHYYQKVTVPRIKLITKNVTDITYRDIKVTRTESKLSFSGNQTSTEKYFKSKGYDDYAFEMSENIMREKWESTM